MNCDEVMSLLSADVDGEVDALRSHALRKHASTCAVCGGRLEAMLETSHRLRSELPYHAAPAALRARLTVDLQRYGPSPATSSRRWHWFGGGMLAGGLLAGLVWLVSSALLQGGLSDDLPTRLVGLHTRATLGNHLIEVASSDRHTVKPWLSARLDYTIPVVDAAAAGYALVGARIDHLDGRPVAVLVYRHRQHIVDVFVRPEVDASSSAASRTIRGFNVVQATGAEMQWLATSDLNGNELAEFVSALAQGRFHPAPD
jgi:anti-sigma factor RsiW